MTIVNRPAEAELPDVEPRALVVSFSLSRRDAWTVGLALMASALMVAGGLYLRAPQTAAAQDFGVATSEMTHPWVFWGGTVYPGSSPVVVYTVPSDRKLVVTGTNLADRLMADGVLQSAGGAAYGPLLGGRGHLVIEPGTALSFTPIGPAAAWLQGYLVGL